jgi:hypothetical protein
LVQAKFPMNVLIAFLLWCLLFVLCWPLALLALFLAPVIGLILLPFWLLGVCVGGVFALLKTLLLLPARLAGWKPA